MSAVHRTGGLLSDAPGGTSNVPGTVFLPEERRREYVSPLAVMSAGRMDHRLLGVPVPGRPSGWAVPESGSAPARPLEELSVKSRMPEDPVELVDAIAVAVRAGDDSRIDALLDRFKEVAGLTHLIRLRERLCGGGRGCWG
ncbi:hypothetical protein [Streptomyces vinaceus]|uniref:hypothetical protein n=1 Tax=Streptomyces vinaceus TaxID=1960 RepID=UPI00380DF4B9